ncbi:HAMP domain-containing sensor histidine kinase [Paenibacillus silvisoli]|uniref:HAMP domain-containing sensor histidine kinase n=1 Tax=Paenibacillus silvisoli TaxID=3110539 RepID=UPI002805BDCC|nr:HAMP domain-containing sensor histidine kinase [Paenibacillus silvisoli]
MAKWKRALLGLAGILLMNAAIYTCYTVAFTIVSYTKERRNHDAVTSALVHDAELIARAVSGVDGSKNTEAWAASLQPIARDQGYRFLVVDSNGHELRIGDWTHAADAAVTKEQVADVLKGKTVKDVNRAHFFAKGEALAGIPVDVGGVKAALFTEREVPILYKGFGQQLFTVFLGFLLLFVVLFMIGKPWKQREGINLYISAIRRMSKGDFSVSIEKPQRMHGDFEKLATSLNDMAAELSHMEQMRQAFISNVSHEIQSPLTSIRGFARVLQQDGLEEEQRQHYAGIIETESVRLSKLSDNLLKLTTLESEKQPLRLKTFRLDQQLRTTILACEPQWTEKQLQLDINLVEELTLNGDEELLSQVWMNLLSNSIKFTPEGGTLSVEAVRKDGGAVVRIADTGIGISEADLPHIFERFFKADKARSRMAGGSGLGLSIAKRIVELHGGSITAASELGAGTAMNVMLPGDEGRTNM